ncbi:fluoride efflux transporter CrcB, partial [Mesorhizobium sp. M1C.F.Ca.ET.195.01.1.1]
MFNLLLVAVGGGIGAGIRHLTSMGALRLVGPNYPWGTMAINIIGSFA